MGELHPLIKWDSCYLALADFCPSRNFGVLVSRETRILDFYVESMAEEILAQSLKTNKPKLRHQFEILSFPED